MDQEVDGRMVIGSAWRSALIAVGKPVSFEPQHVRRKRTPPVSPER